MTRHLYLYRYRSWLLPFLMLWPWLAMAATVPAVLPHATIITPAQAKQMIDKGTLVVDVRSAYEYVEEHIEGAISVPYKERSAHAVHFDARADKFDLSKLPHDKRTPIIFYCNGPECWKSYKASTTAIRAGYTRVFWLRGGIPAWDRQKLPVQ